MAASLQQALTSIRLKNYAALATLTPVGYDYILTFGDEVEYIWNKPWTLVSTLFVLIRYCGLFSVVTFALAGSSFIHGFVKEYVATLSLMYSDNGSCFHSCYVLYTVGSWALWVFMCASELTMVLRTWALYNRSMVVLGTLLTLYTAETILCLACCAVFNAEKNVVITQLSNFSACIFHDPSPFWLMTGTNLAQITLGSLMCLLLVIQFTRESLQMYNVTKRFQLGRYMNLLTRDGLLYFLAILSYSVILILVHMTDVPWNNQVWVVLSGTTEYVPIFTFTPRLILSLRKLHARDLRGRRGSDLDTAFGLVSMSGRTDEGEEGGERGEVINVEA